MWRLSTSQDIAGSSLVCLLVIASPPSPQFTHQCCSLPGSVVELSVHKTSLFSSDFLFFPNGQPILL